MPEIENLAVGEVNMQLGYCESLRAEISTNDKTPITDGHIDIFNGISRSKADLQGRVTVQVKGETHHNKKMFKSESLKYGIERETLEFFERNGGGIFFVVALHPFSPKRRVFHVLLNPFRAKRLQMSMKPEQKTLTVKFKALPQQPREIEKIVHFALRAQVQNTTLGFDPELVSADATFEVHTPDGLDLSAPTVLDVLDHDYTIMLHTKGGLSLPVDMDLTIYPANYLPHEMAINISCGDVTYSRATARQIDATTVELDLSRTLQLVIADEGKHFNASIDLKADEPMSAQLKALSFFEAASKGEAITINGNGYAPDVEVPEPDPGLLATFQRFQRISELLSALHVSPETVHLARLNQEHMQTLGMLHRAVVLDEEVKSTKGNAGRFEPEIGESKLMLMVVPGTKLDYWSVFSPFDPANRERFRLFSISEESDRAVEIRGTAYEGVSSEELGRTLNLNLDGIVDAYSALEEREKAQSLANHKLLHMLAASANASDPHLGHALIEAARALNSWLLEASPDDPTHLINRWQIRKRLKEMTQDEVVEIRRLRRDWWRKDGPLRDLIDACCAILIGDLGDIEHCVNELSDADRELLHSWPISMLVSVSVSASASGSAAVAE